MYGTYLLRFTDRYARVALAFLALGWITHVAAIVLRISEQGALFGPYDLLLLAPGAGIGVYLVTYLRRPNPLYGAFLSPLSTMVLYSLHVFSKEADAARRTVIELVTPIHIIASLLGFVVLTVATVAGVLIIIQEFRLKTKSNPLNPSRRLPALPTLEQFCHRSLLVGFPIYTVGVALGAVWFMRESDAGITRHFIMAAFSWVLYAATIHARIVVGWKGRRAAILTLIAFASALFVVFLSILRTSG